MQKNDRFSKKQEGTVLIKVGVQIWRYNLILAKSTPRMVFLKFLLIPWYFLVFWLHPTPQPPIHWHPHFCYISGIQMIQIWAKFHLCLICSFEISNVFIPAEGTTFNLRLLLGGVLDVTPWNLVKFVWSFHQWLMQHNASVMVVLIFFLKSTRNWARKTIFWLILRGFWFTPSYALWITPQSSAKFNLLWRYILMISFISLAFVAVKL